MRGNRRFVVVVAACGLAILGSVATLRWTSDKFDELLYERGVPPEAGNVLNPADVEWLDYAPNRTRVDPDALKSDLAALRAHLAQVLVLDDLTTPRPSADATQIPRGWTGVDVVAVLRGAEQGASLTPRAGRCGFLEETAADLAGAGWQLQVMSNDAIQTEYPLVTPGPVDLQLRGSSPLGDLTVYAPAFGDFWVVFSVDERTVGESPDPGLSTSADPPPVPCP